ncbi:MAG: CDP-2,3-bis-(O-geranylgeranyl)-sn-glycerol synthase [Candidatus Bathyarchaeia archaeon]
MLTVYDLLTLIYFIAPAYAANSTPVLFAGGRALDLGRNFLDGERILGSHKTVRGTLGGLLSGFAVSIIEYALMPVHHPCLGFAVSVGSILGDLTGAFLKRRAGIKPGDPAPILDQLDFVLGAALLSYPFWNFTPFIVLVAVLITPPIHLAANVIAYLLGLKDKYW